MNYDNNSILTIDDIKNKISNFINKDKYYPINKIILFGSYAKGTASKNSDIDLLVCDSESFGGIKNFTFRSELKELFLKEIDLFIDRNIDKKSNFYKNIEKEGIVIYEKIDK